MKLLIAIMSKDDRDETEKALTSEGFMLTELGSTGGFLKKKNVTVLIGTDADRVSRAKEILRETAGRRSMLMYQHQSSSTEAAVTHSISVPVDTVTGGCTVFEVDAASMSKF